MKVKSFKKLFVSITLSAALTFSTAATTFAATAQLSPIEQPAELTQEATSDVPDIDFSDTQNAGASLTAQSGISQVAATVNSVTVQWNSVSNAEKYAVSISNFNSSSYRLLGYIGNAKSKATLNKLKAGTAYNIKITALDSSGTAISSRIAGCTTLYTSVSVKSSYASTTSGYTFNMQLPNPSNAISGYKVVYQSSAAQKPITKYFDTRYSFTLPASKNAFYQVKIYPYIILNNKRYVSTKPTIRYFALGIMLQKAGNTNSTMSVKWNKTAGATSYSVYVKYPGGNSYKKVKTTTATSFKLNNMKKNVKYGIKVLANKKVGGKTWQSATNAYTMTLTGR